MTLSRVSIPDLDSYLASERAAVDYCNEVVDGSGRLLHIDRVVSMSALVEVEDDFDYVPDHNELFQRKILNAS